MKRVAVAVLLLALLGGIVAIFLTATQEWQGKRIEARARRVMGNVTLNYLGASGKMLGMDPGGATLEWQGTRDPAVLLRRVAEELPMAWAELTADQRQDVYREIVRFTHDAALECWFGDVTHPLSIVDPPGFEEEPIMRLDEEKLRGLAADAARRLTREWKEHTNR